MKSQIETVLGKMSLREKIGQTVQLGLGSIPLQSRDAAAEFLDKYPIGSVFMGCDIIKGAGSTLYSLDALTLLQSASKIPLSVAGDLESGAGCVSKRAVRFPPLMALGATDDAELAFRYGFNTAVEGLRVGYDWAFAPVVDILRNWQNPIIIPRSLGDNPDKIAELGSAIVRGMQQGGMTATLKHFPGDGVDFRDQHLTYSANTLSRDEWFATYGKVFRACIKAGAGSVMIGHIALPFLDKEVGTLSKPIITDLLKGELDFQGVVVSDALIMSGFVMSKPASDRLLRAFAAGMDVMLWPELEYFDDLERAIQDGKIPESRLDDAVRRILLQKFNTGILEHPRALDFDAPLPVPDAVELAATLADKCVTEARNRIGLLPLDPAKVKRVLVLYGAVKEGPDAAKGVQPLLDEFAKRGIEVKLHINGNCLDLKKMELAGERFDALFCVYTHGMHAMKNTMRPTGPMAELLWTVNYAEFHRPIMLSFSTPYIGYENEKLDTIVNAYCLTPATAHSALAAIFGEIPFAGKSPVKLEM